MDSQHNNYNNVIYLAYFVKIVVSDLIISVLSSAGAIFVKISLNADTSNGSIESETTHLLSCGMGILV